MPDIPVISFVDYIELCHFRLHKYHPQALKMCTAKHCWKPQTRRQSHVDYSILIHYRCSNSTISGILTA